MAQRSPFKNDNTSVLVMAILQDGPLHGYGIAREIRQRSSEALKLGEGTLYPVLRALEQDDLVESRWETQASGPARRLYVLTEKGTHELQKRRSEWAVFSAAVDAVLKGGPNAEPA